MLDLATTVAVHKSADIGVRGYLTVTTVPEAPALWRVRGSVTFRWGIRCLGMQGQYQVVFSKPASRAVPFSLLQTSNESLETLNALHRNTGPPGWLMLSPRVDLLRECLYLSPQLFAGKRQRFCFLLSPLALARLLQTCFF